MYNSFYSALESDIYRQKDDLIRLKSPPSVQHVHIDMLLNIHEVQVVVVDYNLYANVKMIILTFAYRL